MSKLLVPTDFSGVSDEAAQTALKLAKKSNMEVIFIHLISSENDQIISNENREKFQREIMGKISDKSRKLEVLVESANRERVKASREIKYDQSYKSLLEYINHNQVFMVVMGTHGAKGTRELLVGSNSQMIARFSPAPVLVVKEGYVHESISKLAFVSDFSNSPSAGFQKIVDVSVHLHLDLHLVFINTPDEFQTSEHLYNKMQEYVKASDNHVKSQNSFNALNLEEGISEYCETYNIDLIAMITHERKGTSTIMHSSLTEKLINHLIFPVLCVHD